MKRIVLALLAFVFSNAWFMNLALDAIYNRSGQSILFNQYILLKSGNLVLFKPFAYIQAYLEYQKLLPSLFKAGNLYVAIGIVVGMIALAIIRFMGNQKVLDSSGSAAWATHQELKDENILVKAGKDTDGCIVGTYYSGLFNYEKYYNFLVKVFGKKIAFNIIAFTPSFICGREYIMDNKPSHTIMVAPSRSGKGVGVVIPTLLTWKNSSVVADLKGELIRDTGNYRRYVLGHNVIEFSPTSATPSYRFNPLNEVRWGTPHEGKDVGNIVAAITGSAEGKDKHWIMNARSLLEGVVTHLKYYHSKKNFENGWDPDDPEYIETNFYHVYEFLTTSIDEDGNTMEFKEKLEAIIETYTHFPCRMWVHNKNSKLPMLLVNITQETAFKIMNFTEESLKKASSHPVVVNSFSSFASKPANEGGSILSTAITAVSIFSEKLIADNTCTSDFILGDLRTLENPTDLYLVMPASEMSRCGSLFRLIIEFIIIRNLESLDAVEGLHKTLFLIDEFPAFGKLENFIRQLGFIAGFGLKALVIVQGLDQIKGIYDKSLEIMTNCETQIYLAPRDETTPEVLHKILGQKTIMIKQKSKKRSLFDVPSYSYVEKGRDLLTREEIMVMPDSVILSGTHKIKTPKNKFFINSDMLDKLAISKELAKENAQAGAYLQVGWRGSNIDI